ncbi:replication initiation protein RepC [Epibacterium ulvae]|uniref:plasmid replication protein RepC n=1 Tax=Epibacterium ulvae TaxID=1156985 RepID=UPI001BFC2BE6|nr:plasmid replication protein RepC [Epibacterium ulvae]MBT8152680.1 replication initiation protein RepC [Epibacterium ulvae]
MQHLTTTPFGRRPVAAGLIARAAAHRQVADPIAVEKWSLFRDLTTARKSFDIGDRTLMVLNALLTFLPDKTLAADTQLVVYPSNRSLSDRCHGMAESTLRRHLAALVDAGLISRHDSPNGKRYVRRGRGGQIAHAFGFDLTPLLHRATEITDKAEEARRLAAETSLIRERISLMRRDALKLAEFGLSQDMPADWPGLNASLEELTKRLRRKLSLENLSQIEECLVDILSDIRQIIEPKSEELSGCDGQTERHHQSSKKDILESEQPAPIHNVTPLAKPKLSKEKPTLPLTVVLQACPDVLSYCEGPPTNWRDLIAAASFLRGMMGIDHTAWDEAMRLMGPEAAATTLACILQRFGDIRNPGGYLRSLSAKAASGSFSPAPMVMSLINASNQTAA